MDSPTLRRLAEDFLVYKRSLGYAYETGEHYLMRFVSHSEQGFPDERLPAKAAVDSFLEKLAEGGAGLYICISVLREFSLYLRSRGFAGAYSVPPKTARQPLPEPPYLFTEEELEAFFEKLDGIEAHPAFKGRELAIPAMFRLLYCCGLRPKEARTLRCEDAHLDDGFIDVLQSKGPKSRRIYISGELASYLKGYDEAISALFPGREYFFPCKGGHYGKGAVSENFRRFWLLAFPGFKMEGRPRAYDLRHHFAWANINKWASEGLDVNAMLPYLMRYMGHQSVKETLYYFHFVPEFFPTYREIAKPLEDILPEVPDEG